MKFHRLPLTRDLTDAIQALYPRETDALTGWNANKATLLHLRLEDYRRIVFATHGYFGFEIPLIREPVLALTLVDQPRGSDGFLRMTEVMGLNLNADVVALTACQSGLGRSAAGEGIMSMGRAFQYAGARSVLMSLWSVSERASVDIMKCFFRHLKEGKNRLDALALARTEIRRAGYEHPFYWAAFVLVGEVE
jgi:CHAT domain-containing protein